MSKSTRAEALYHETEPARDYTYEYLCYRVTEFRPAVSPAGTISGADAAHDLGLFIEDLSDSADIDVTEVSEQVLTVNELSRTFNVSPKTISRWRGQGLVSRKFVFNGRKRIGFLSSSVQRYVASNPDRVRRSGEFSQLTDMERNDIVQRARRLTHAGGGLADVARRIARHTKRSVETIRYTLKQFDEAHPHSAVFGGQAGPLSPEAKNKIYREYRGGTSVEVLARRFGRTKTSIYRIVNEIRAGKISELPLDYMYNPEFDRAEADRVILGPMPAAGETKRRKIAYSDGIASLSGVALRGSVVDAGAGAALVP